jgi:hypothetical protein
MKKSVFCLAIVFSFIVGIMFGPLILVLYSKIKAPGRYQQELEAKSFFYKTMHELFEDTDSHGKSTLSESVLNKFNEYKPQLGGKCALFIIDSTPGYYECYTFFPSGDIFSLAITQQDGRWKIEGFNLQDWDRLWKDRLSRYGVIN